MPVSMPPRIARTIALASGASPFLAFRPGLNGVLDGLNGSGYAQIDTIGVVERAHMHFASVRSADYGADPWSALEGFGPDKAPRAVIEYWAHAAAYLPLASFRYCLPRMERLRREGHEWFRAESAVVEYVRARIRDEGPLRAHDFEQKIEGRKGWWDWKPAKVALEYLFHAGELISLTRRGFQKVYELAERGLPDGLDLRCPDSLELAFHHVDRIAAAYGVFCPEEAGYLRKDGTADIGKALSVRCEEGRLVEARIEGVEGKRFYVATSALEKAETAEASGSQECRAAVLSPFDPCILDRKRLKRLFGEDFTLECYVPAEKRAFGYFALPILARLQAGDGCVLGKADCKAERKAKILSLRRLELRRPGFAAQEDPERLATATALALRRLMSAVGAERVELDRFDVDDPPLHRAALAAFQGAGLRVSTRQNQPPSSS